MKPSQTPDTTAILPIVLANAIAVARVSFAVSAPRTTSSSRMTFAGLKKCRPMTSFARFTKRPKDVIGLHFFSPANVMRLLEVVRGAETANDTLATAMALAKTIGKIAVVSGVCDGFIGNRMVARYGMAAHDLLVAGALPRQIDAALQNFGMAMGPFRMADLARLDIGLAIRKRPPAGFSHE